MLPHLSSLEQDFIFFCDAVASWVNPKDDLRDMFCKVKAENETIFTGLNHDLNVWINWLTSACLPPSGQKQEWQRTAAFHW